MQLYGHGSQTRSFCYVSHEIDGFMRLTKSSAHLPVNIGNPSEFTILECAQRVLAVTGSKSKIKYEPLPEDDPKQRQPDIPKSKNLAGLGAQDRSRNWLADVAGIFSQGDLRRKPGPDMRKCGPRELAHQNRLASTGAGGVKQPSPRHFPLAGFEVPPEVPTSFDRVRPCRFPSDYAVSRSRGTEQNRVDPWYFQVDSVPTTLICDTIHNLNVKGETWQANVTNILNGPTEGLFKGNTLID
jgi:hypothetical protein